MKRVISFYRILFIFSIFTLVSCEAEGLYLKEKQGKAKGTKTIKKLTGKEAQETYHLLKKKFSSKLSLSNFEMRTTNSLPEIDFNNILLVMDSLGIKNYTFKIVNHPDDNYKTFHNLVLTDNHDELKATLMKYEMTTAFAEEFNVGLKTFNEFEGKIKAISPVDEPCDPVEIIYPIDVINPNEANPSGGGGGALGPTPGIPNTGGSTGGNTGGSGGGGSNCSSVSVSFTCNGKPGEPCGRYYDSIASYIGSGCNSSQYSVTITFTYYHICRIGYNPCSPEGDIGVIEPDCNSFSERVKEVLNTEGGFINDPLDPGGPTNKGISWAVWLENANITLGVQPTLENLQALTEEQAKLIYKSKYWDKVRCDDIVDGDLRYLLFDFHINSGKNAVKVLKKTLNSLGYNLVVNGTMDDETIQAINDYSDIKTLYNTYKLKRQQFYQDIVDRSVQKYLIKKPNATQNQINTKTQKKWLNGWTNRVNKFLNKTEERLIDVNC